MSAPGGTNRNVVLAICCMSLFIVGLDVSALNLALPSIRESLGASDEELQWILDAYTVVLAGLLLLSGSIADRVGRKRVFRIGLVVFGLGSVLCAFAPTGGFLIGARALQAIGGSMLNPVAMSIITTTFREPAERARAIGMWGAANGLSMALGPLIGGALVEYVSWEAVFWMNVPVVLVALVLTTLYVPESRAEKPRAFDPAGQLLVVLALAGLTFGIIEGRSAGWTSATVLGAFAVAALAAVAFSLVERRVAEPLIDPRFFHNIPFSGAVLSAVLGFSAMAGFLFLNSLYLQSVRGFSPVEAGLVTLPMAVLNGVTAPISGRIVGARGPRVPMVLAGLGIGASALVLVTLTPTTPVALLFCAYALFGFGFGLLNAPITNAAVSGMPRDRAGVASGVASASRQVGAALGVAVFGTLAFGGLTGEPGVTLAEASHPAWWLMFACGVGLVGMGVLVTSRVAERSAARVREEFEVEG